MATEQPGSTKVVKVATAVTAGGSFLVLSGLTFVGTVFALALATPLMVLFSPVLVPATITVALIFAGFLSSGGLGVAAVTVLAWMVRYLSGKKAFIGDGLYLDEARSRLASKVREMKERAELYAKGS